MWAIRSVLVLAGAMASALCASAVALDFREDFETGNLSPDEWVIGDESRSSVASRADGLYMKVDEDGSSISRQLAGDGGLEPDGDVVFDALVRFTATDSLEPPTLPNDAKFALWLYGDGSGTNLYVTAGGAPVSNTRCATVNYRLKVENVDLSCDAWHRMTVRAIKSIGPAMMGFVVFIDGEMAVCDEEGYRDKIPDVGGVTPLVEYLLAEKALFPSLLSQKHISAQQLKSVDFAGIGRIDNLTVSTAPDRVPGFSQFGGYFVIGWTKGVEGFEYRVGETGDFVRVDTSDFADALKMVVEVGDAEVVCVTNILYDVLEDCHGPVGLSFLASGGSGVIRAEQYNFRVGDAVYTTLSEACVAVAEGGVVSLLRDVAESWDLSAGSIFVEKPFTLDLAGRTLCISNNNVAVFYMKSAGISIISSEEGGSIIVAGGSRSLLSFDRTANPMAAIGALGGDRGVTVEGRLVSGTVSNVAIARGRFTDSDAVGLGGSVALPRGVAPDYQERYNRLFRFSVSDVGGTYMVIAELDLESEALKGVEDSVAAAARCIDLAKVAGGASEERVELDAEPGLYYGISSGETLDGMAVNEWELATGERMELDVPRRKSGQTAGFYRVEASATTPLAR